MKDGICPICGQPAFKVYPFDPECCSHCHKKKLLGWLKQAKKV